MSPNLVQTDAQRPEPALNRWRPTLGSTLAIPEEHAPAERISVRLASKRHGVGTGRAILFSSCGSARQPTCGRVDARSGSCAVLRPLFTAVQQIYVRLKTPEQATKTTTDIFSVFLLLFSWQVVLVQATFGHNDKAEHG